LLISAALRLRPARLAKSGEARGNGKTREGDHPACTREAQPSTEGWGHSVLAAGFTVDPRQGRRPLANLIKGCRRQPPISIEARDHGGTRWCADCVRYAQGDGAVPKGWASSEPVARRPVRSTGDVLVKLPVNDLQSSISQDGTKNGSLCATTRDDLDRTQPVASVKTGIKRRPARAPAIARKGPRQKKGAGKPAPGIRL